MLTMDPTPSRLGSCGVLVSGPDVAEMLLRNTNTTFKATLLMFRRHTPSFLPLLVLVSPQSVLRKSNGDGTAAKAWA